MRVCVIDSDDKRHAAKIAENGQFVTIARCPSCGTESPQIRGIGVTHHDHDTYYARAVAACCDVDMRMETTVSTIFGIDEDEAMLVHGRARVY